MAKNRHRNCKFPGLDKLKVKYRVSVATKYFSEFKTLPKFKIVEIFFTNLEQNRQWNSEELQISLISDVFIACSQ